MDTTTPTTFNEAVRLAMSLGTPEQRAALSRLVHDPGTAERERVAAKIMRALEAAGPDGLTASELHRKVQLVRPTLRVEVMRQLLAEGVVVSSVLPGTGRPANVYHKAQSPLTAETLRDALLTNGPMTTLDIEDILGPVSPVRVTAVLDEMRENGEITTEAFIQGNASTTLVSLTSAAEAA